MLGCGNSSRNGYPLHALCTPQIIPETSFLYEFCSCHRNLLPVPGISLTMNVILFMLCYALYKVVCLKILIFCHKNAKVLSQEIFVLLHEFVSCQQNLNLVNTNVFLLYEKYSCYMIFLLVQKNSLTCNRCPKKRQTA